MDKKDASEAMPAKAISFLRMRRSCQHTAIRFASEHPDGLFSTDQLRAMYSEFKVDKDSRWRSSIMRELAKAGVFSQVGYRKSEHLKRGSRPMMLWKMTPNIRDILRWVDLHPSQTPDASQQTLFEI
jgi:hypothetical protein